MRRAVRAAPRMIFKEPGNPGAGGERVLVVDDTEEELRAAALILRQQGFRVQEAGSGGAASELIDREDFDVVLTDLVMRGISGYQVIQTALRKDPCAVCVAMTSHGSLDSAMEALNFGAYSYLTKPILPADLRHVLARGLEKRRLTAELRQRNLELEALNRDLDAKVRQATAELVEANRRIRTEMCSLQDVDKAKSAFLANVSHDLKNPLMAVMSYLRLLLEGEFPDAEDQRKCLAGASRAAAHIQHLVNQLLDAAELTSAKVALNLQSFAARDLFDLCEAINGPLAQAAGLPFELLPPPASLTLRADRYRLLQALNNLVGNAVKFTPRGGVVTLSARAEGGDIVFCVADQGPGIPPDQLERIFDRFYQGTSPAASGYRGLGLGLHICSEIVQLHSGRIWAESAAGQGSRLQFRIPLEPPPARGDGGGS